MFDQATNSLPQVRGGTVKAYAVTSRTRLASAPDIPTVDEAGAPGLSIAYWHAIWAPKNTPAEHHRDPERGGAGGAGRSRRAATVPRTRPGDAAARQANPGGAEGAPECRDREMVADREGGEYQGGVRPLCPGRDAARSSCEALLRRTGTRVTVVSDRENPALQRTAPQELRAALRPGNEPTPLPSASRVASPRGPRHRCNRGRRGSASAPSNLPSAA